MTAPTLPTALAAIGMQCPESAKSIDEIHDAFSHVHAYAMHKTTTPYMSIPARPGVDADLVVSAAIVELGELRALCLALAVRVKEAEAKLPIAAEEIDRLKSKVDQKQFTLELENPNTVRTCPRCAGSGWAANDEDTCTYCHGSGRVA